MIPVSIKQVTTLINGNSYGITDDNVIVNAVNTDSRSIESQSLFIALKGDYFDGHAFVKQAIASGAVAVVVSHQIDANIPQIVVSDTKHALGQIAAFVRQQVPTKIVALTGSSGKTSVKEMTAVILQHCGSTLYTQGNFNNDIGVPLTLLRLTPQDQFAVIELGANHIGEIAYTSNIVKPQSALINNIAEAHIEGFGSLAGVAQAKGEIFQGLPKNGVAIINLDSCSSNWFAMLSNPKIWTFSLEDNSANFYALDIQEAATTTFILHTPSGNCRIESPLIGRHNISNMIASAALAMSVGASFNEIKLGLLHLKPVKGRLFPIKLSNTQLIWDDSYNANVGSMTAAINVLAKQPGYKVLVVGDMAELGDNSASYHEKLGKLAKQVKLDCVVSIGTFSALISQGSGVGHHFTNKADACDFLMTLLQQHTVLTMLVKGSRSAKMEDLIELIKIQKNKVSQD